MRPEEFSNDWIVNAARFDGAKLNGFTPKAIGTGQMCDSFRLSLDWAQRAGAPASIVAKCPATDPASREAGKALHCYELEARWYMTYAGEAPIRTPHCYHVELGADMTSFILLLEDLAPAEQGDQLAGADMHQMEQAVDEAAKLHAHFWNRPDVLEQSWLRYGENNRAFIREFVPQVYPTFCERYEGRLSAEVLGLGHDLVAKWSDYLEDTGAHPKTITHNDLRLDNMLFSDADGRAIVVDWQTLGLGAGPTDVAYLLGTSFADANERAAQEEALVRRYHEALLRGGVKDYPWEACWLTYRASAFSGFIMAVVASMLVERTERGDEMFAVMAERPALQALHLDSLALI